MVIFAYQSTPTAAIAAVHVNLAVVSAAVAFEALKCNYKLLF